MRGHREVEGQHFRSDGDPVSSREQRPVDEIPRTRNGNDHYKIRKVSNERVLEWGAVGNRGWGQRCMGGDDFIPALNLI